MVTFGFCPFNLSLLVNWNNFSWSTRLNLFVFFVVGLTFFVVDLAFFGETPLCDFSLLSLVNSNDSSLCASLNVLFVVGFIFFGVGLPLFSWTLLCKVLLSVPTLAAFSWLEVSGLLKSLSESVVT